MSDPTPETTPASSFDPVPAIAGELSLAPGAVHAVVELLAEGNTVPFIARYRKERTGELDEVKITSIRDRLEQLGELDKRRESIAKSLEERKLLTLELKTKIDSAATLNALEDLYAPYRPKKREAGRQEARDGCQGCKGAQRAPRRSHTQR